MKKMVLKATNYAGYVGLSYVVGRLWGMFIAWLCKGFLNDEEFAASHPKKYLWGVFGITVFSSASAVLIFTKPLKMLMEFVDSKIDAIPEDEDKEWD